jgi:hypothetical protein
MNPREAEAARLLVQAEAALARRALGSAMELFNRAEVRGADEDRCSAGRWMLSMLRGDFASAWRESDLIRERGAPDAHRVWQGDDIAGKRVIVRCLHGFGDTVQFMRYAALLNERAETVIWEVPLAMTFLARCFRSVDHLQTWCEGDVDHRKSDVQVEVTELPYLFRTTVAELPIARRYIDLPAAIIRRAARETGRKTAPRVGVVWSAGSWNTTRSIPFDVMRPLFECEDCEFWNLQGGPCRQVEGTCGLRDSAACKDGLLPLAGIISQLDLVLTVDTLAAHLAGSLEIPTWLMLQYAADWRWMVGTDDSPWYPSLRLFRQPAGGGWTDVVEAVRTELRHWSHEMTERLSA